jgi:hypothetical protein
MAEENFFKRNIQGFKNETGQDFCLIHPVFFEQVDKELKDSFDSSIEDLLGNSFQVIKGLIVISESQKQTVINHVKNFVPAEEA